jgi:phosphocarrier protein
MENGSRAMRRQAVIVNTYGLHMRPSTKFVKLASSFKSDVWVHFEGKKANGKSLLEMTTLAAQRGATLELEAQGPDAEQALAALSDLVAAGFHMEEDGA